MKVKIVWTTIAGQQCEKLVNQADAQAEMEHLRTLPDVRTATVRIAF